MSRTGTWALDLEAERDAALQRAEKAEAGLALWRQYISEIALSFGGEDGPRSIPASIAALRAERDEARAAANANKEHYTRAYNPPAPGQEPSPRRVWSRFSGPSQERSRWNWLPRPSATHCTSSGSARLDPARSPSPRRSGGGVSVGDANAGGSVSTETPRRSYAGEVLELAMDLQPLHARERAERTIAPGHLAVCRSPACETCREIALVERAISAAVAEGRARHAICPACGEAMESDQAISVEERISAAVELERDACARLCTAAERRAMADAAQARDAEAELCCDARAGLAWGLATEIRGRGRG